ncbi:putative nuclease HARBI1 [Olea europaea var. sylvestris]|uniref:putative nuclease HARBI1 n=1 Tax=Olea europaea var. sylvestris TaxID=158386 RepID=UPI000C1D7548|nr:putative nuclease HARBI1 [Olea europaea var. sylvestris]
MDMQAIVIYKDLKHRARHLPRAPHTNWNSEREITLTRMFSTSNTICRDLLRMKIGPFQRLCARLRTYGLVDMSFYFHRVLHAFLRLYRDVVINATPHNSPYEKENDVVGAIDETHIAVYVPLEEQGKYRNRKKVIFQNVLVACTFDMKFTYVLAGWEGSAHDGQLLRSEILRQGHKLTIHVGKYYLVDAGFPSVSGFLAPCRRTRYHRREIEGQRPESSKELFNSRHSSLRNVIERTIGLLKKRFAYLRHQSYHDIDTQAKIVLACYAIHNFLRIDDVEDVCKEDYDLIN